MQQVLCATGKIEHSICNVSCLHFLQKIYLEWKDGICWMLSDSRIWKAVQQKVAEWKEDTVVGKMEKDKVISFHGKDVNERAEYLLDAYGNSILRLAYSYLHNKSDAEEILQDTLLQYLRVKPLFENTNHEKAWLLRVAANLSKNKISYNRLRMTDELQEELVAKEQEDLAFVWDAVKELPEPYREVVHLYYEEWYSTKEIAILLQRKEATVRSDLRRARKRLKEILKEAYDFE